jgi:hypothetical protein
VTAHDHVCDERYQIDNRLDRTMWRHVMHADDGDCWMALGGLKVIWSAAEEEDGKIWMHVSVSRPTRLPSYTDLARVKALFIGDRVSYSVWATAADHVNIHQNCLHLWAVLEGEEPLPDFTRGLGSI